MGCVGGFLNGALGIGNSSLVAYFSALQLTGTAMRDTFALIYTAAAPSLFGARVYYGMVKTDEWLIYTMGLPMNYVGTFVGLYLHSFVHNKVTLSFVQAVVLIGSILLTKPWVSGTFHSVMLGVYIAVVLISVGIAVWRVRRANKIRREVQEECEMMLQELGG